MADQERTSTSGVKRGTGRERADWFRLLDRWGARDHPSREITAWLRDEHGLSRWWAQKLMVEYEQERGVRSPGARPGGTFTVTASKTIRTYPDRAYRSFADARARARWLGDAVLKRRSSEPGRRVRFDWGDGPSRVSVMFEPKGADRVLVSVVHERLPDARRPNARSRSGRNGSRGRMCSGGQAAARNASKIALAGRRLARHVLRNMGHRVGDPVFVLGTSDEHRWIRDLSVRSRVLDARRR